MVNDVRIEGAEKILRKLKLLPQRIGNNAMRRALRKGANVVRDAAKNNAKRIDDPETRDQIWKNIAVASGGRRREKQAGGPMMRVGVRGGAKPLPKDTDTGLPGGNTTHWRFVEFGTSDTKAQPFLRPAAAESASAAIGAIVTDMTKQLDKEIAKLI